MLNDDDYRRTVFYEKKLPKSLKRKWPVRLINSPGPVLGPFSMTPSFSA